MPSDALRLRGAAYLGWRMPTLNELYRPFRLGPDATAANADLEPERLKGAEVGVEWRPAGPIRFALTFFDNRLEQAIANVTLGKGPGQFPGVGFVVGQFRQRQNIKAVVSRGVELDAEVSLGSWRLAAGYSYANAHVDADGVARALDDRVPAQTPRHSAAASVSRTSPQGAAATIALRYVGSQFEDDLNEDRLPDALTLAASVAWPLTRRLKIEARGENITNERVVAGISGAGIIERATPRTMWIGLHWNH